MIELKNLTVSYARATAALEQVSLTVPRGTVAAVIGPSGCGKSTLLKVVAGLIRDYAGTATIDGAPVDTKKLKIGFMPQNYGLLPWQTVAKNIRLGLKIRGELQAADEQEITRLMAELGLTGLESRYPRELSGGQQQRVGLARAFLLRPDILLMDEPFSALDTITREEMQEVFLGLWRQSQITTMLVTHYVEEALYLGQKIVLMSGTPGHIAEVWDNPLAGSDRSTPDFLARAQELRAKVRQVMGA